MNILLASRFAWPTTGGIERSLVEISRTLAGAGHKVWVFSYSQGPDVDEDNPDIHYIRRRFVSTRFTSLDTLLLVCLSIRHLKRIYKEHAIDCIWTRSASLAVAANLSGMRGRVTHIFSTIADLNFKGLFRADLSSRGLSRVRNGLERAFGLPISRRIDAYILRRTRTVVFSKNLAGLIESSYGPARDLRQILPGINTSIFSPDVVPGLLEGAPESVTRLRDMRYFVYVGRLCVEKDLDYLLRAFPHVSESHQLVIVGTGPREKVLKQLASELSLDERVIFYGACHQHLPAIYHHADALIMPTRLETFGHAVLEAQACGTPVIGIRSNQVDQFTASDEIILDGRTGFVADSPEPAVLATCINRICEMPEGELEKMRIECVRHVREKFSWVSFTTRVLEDAEPATGDEHVSKGAGQA